MIKAFLSNGLGLMVVAALVFALSDVMIKFLSDSFPPAEIAFIRFLLGLLILWPIFSSREVSLRGNHTRFLILRGIFGTLSFLCLVKSIALIPLSDAMVLFYTFPIFVTLFSFLLYRERVKREVLMLIAVGLVGIYILINPTAETFRTGHLLVLLSSCFGGMAMVFIGKARETNGPLIIYFYFCLIGGCLSLPFLIMDFRMPDMGQWMILMLIGLTGLIAQVLMNQGLQFCQAAEGSVILMSEVVFAGIAGFLIFKDPVTLHFLIGAFLIVGSGIGITLLHRKP